MKKTIASLQPSPTAILLRFARSSFPFPSSSDACHAGQIVKEWFFLLGVNFCDQQEVQLNWNYNVCVFHLAACNRQVKQREEIKTRYLVSLYFNGILLQCGDENSCQSIIIVLNTLKTSPIFICQVPVRVLVPDSGSMFSIRLSWPNLGVFMTWPRCVIINLILCLFLVRFPSDEMTDNLSVQKVN